MEKRLCCLSMSMIHRLSKRMLLVFMMNYVVDLHPCCTLHWKQAMICSMPCSQVFSGLRKRIFSLIWIIRLYVPLRIENMLNILVLRNKRLRNCWKPMVLYMTMQCDRCMMATIWEELIFTIPGRLLIMSIVGSLSLTGWIPVQTKW